jgi:hypothetical protein
VGWRMRCSDTSPDEIIRQPKEIISRTERNLASGTARLRRK